MLPIVVLRRLDCVLEPTKDAVLAEHARLVAAGTPENAINTEANFSAFFGRILDDLFIQRMEGNDEIFNRVMNDKQFRSAAQEHLAREVYERIRSGRQEE